MKYTVEEVRAMASDLRGAPGTSMIGTHISLPTAMAVAIYEALCAYAERIEADEGAVTKLIVDTICNAALGHDNYGYETQDRVHAALLAMWPNPPAQAAQSVDIEAIREVIESHINEAKKLRHDPESQDYLYEQADKLEAALQEKGNG